MLIHIHKNHCVSLRHGHRRHHQAMRLAFLPLDERRGVTTAAVPAAVFAFQFVYSFPFRIRYAIISR